MNTKLKLDTNEIEKVIYKLVKKYFYDGIHSSTNGMSLSESNYDILRYTLSPRSDWFSRSARPTMNKDTYKLNEFRKEVRTYLKTFGVTHVRFDTSSGKVHYGYVMGNDDFPVTYLNAIYFN